MSLKQLTVFVPNRKGTMVAVTDILAKNNVNLRALSLAETEDFGILRLIVNDEKTAEAVLEQNGYFIVSDKPGETSVFPPLKLNDLIILGEKDLSEGKFMQ